MKNILILFAHPAFKKSKINAALRKAVQNLEGVTFHDLYANYPDFLIDIKHEQRLCEEHDVIIMQHPFYWYSTPSILKEWQDLVLEYNWAYGQKGTALRGKVFFQAITAGGNDDVYHHDGYNMFTIQELTAPFRPLANLCGMEWLPPFAILGVHRNLPSVEVVNHSEKYRRLIIAVRDDQLDMDTARQKPRLDIDLDDLIIKG